MSEDIKEILDVENYRNKDGYIENISLLPSEIDKLLDCITNLQEENERLKERENKLQEKFKDWKKEIEKEKKYYLCDRTDCCGRIKDSKKYNSIYRELKDYKSRCEKAIDVLEELIAEFQLNDYITDFDKKMNKPLNILQGGDE